MIDPSTAVSLLTPIGGVARRFATMRQLGLDGKPLKRLFLVECECNLALLACLRLEDPNTAQTGESLWRIAENLETDVLEMILGTGDLESKVFKSLRSVPLLSADAGEHADGALTESPEMKVMVGERLRRLYVNCTAVRTAASIHLKVDSPTDSGMRNMRFRTRLSNLRLAYAEIARSLRADQRQETA